MTPLVIEIDEHGSRDLISLKWDLPGSTNPRISVEAQAVASGVRARASLTRMGSQLLKYTAPLR
jgi:hypothetical protein